MCELTGTLSAFNCINDMARKKIDSKASLRNAYMDFILKSGQRPKNIYSFVQEFKIPESEFYDHYGSFKAIEKSVFQAFFENTISLLNENKDYHSFDAANKLLSFYFTFFEILKANRSYVVCALEENKNLLFALSTLSEMKKSFHDFIQELDIETPNFPEEKLQKFKDKALVEGAWGQFIFTLKFWLDDSSKGFEKTDVFIEKSITTSFALLDNSTLNSVFDLGKFLFKEKIMSN
jgi:hypothetical protein